MLSLWAMSQGRFLTCNYVIIQHKTVIIIILAALRLILRAKMNNLQIEQFTNVILDDIIRQILSQVGCKYSNGYQKFERVYTKYHWLLATCFTSKPPR